MKHATKDQMLPTLMRVTPSHITLTQHTTIEVERNLAANNVTTLTPWRLFNDFFPLPVPTDIKKQFTQAESLMYRYRVRVRVG